MGGWRPLEICGRAFNRKDKLSLHRKTHNAEKPYQCPTCLKCFCRSDYLLMHRKTAHPEEEVSQFPCLACGTVFGKGKDLSAHIRTAHFSCADCDAAFLTEGELAAHAEAEKHNSGQQLDCVDCEPSQYLESQPPASQPAPQALSLEQDFRQLLPATAPGMLPTPADQEVLELLTLLANNKDSPKLTRWEGHELHLLLTLGSEWPTLSTTTRNIGYNRTRILAIAATHGWETESRVSTPEEILWRLHTLLWVQTGERPFAFGVCHKRFSQKSTLNHHAKMH
ncbi:oocyte zinc finger protein XlCOF8.4-like isoform X2 [Ischnura elegans]|uniref:oocyte zinc finger protein XlCOF8.4-like isoform X2 n=1 Tax=Ischnura elegans TaxID=197161 RepID=UPI001ED88F20|nr:oocyte zinc finger protein XlCOF8.4-like isoform X2 [Ischnura elegans]